MRHPRELGDGALRHIAVEVRRRLTLELGSEIVETFFAPSGKHAKVALRLIHHTYVCVREELEK